MKTTTANQKTKRTRYFCSCATGPCASNVDRGLSRPNPQDIKKMNKNELNKGKNIRFNFFLVIYFNYFVYINKI